MTDAIDRNIQENDAAWTLDHYNYLYLYIQSNIVLGWSEQSTVDKIRSFTWHGSNHRDRVVNAARYLYRRELENAQEALKKAGTK